jgi:hypothetical protein
MPDQLNKQSLINLLIDSPLREPIKINLIDIINNTSEPDLPKVYSTITKELEIFQKATERRMKLAEETIAKLGGTATTPVSAPSEPTTSSPAAPTAEPAVMPPTTPVPTSEPALSVPPLDLPPLPQVAPTEPSLPPTPPVVDTPMPTPESPTPVPPATPITPNLTPLGGAPMTASSDEDALAEIQKELDSLKTTTANEISSAATPIAEPAAPVTPPVQQ